MAEILRRLLWFFIVSCAVAYAFFLLVGSTIHANAIDSTRVVIARDSLGPGVHNLAGMVMVRSTCSELTVRTHQLSETEFQLQFSTWNESSLASCVQEDTPRSFRALVFAPAVGVSFSATLDDEPLILNVIPSVEHRY